MLTNPAILARETAVTAPLIAFGAIDVREIVRQATEDGVDEPAIDLRFVDGDQEQVGVTCTIEMALRLLCAWMEVATRTPTEDRDLHVALKLAAVAVYAAYDAARDPERISLGEIAHIHSSF